jgi:hypothetical protein
MLTISPQLMLEQVSSMITPSLKCSAPRCQNMNSPCVCASSIAAAEAMQMMGNPELVAAIRVSA